MEKTIYLIGGFMINDNFGDVIQARVWIDFYEKLDNVRVVFLHYKDGKQRIQEALPGIKLENYEDFMTRLKSNEGIDCVHMYGGGYLNKYWGDDFLKLIVKLKDLKIPLIVTGIQIDETFYKKYRKQIGRSPKYFKWVSYRGEASRKLMGVKDAYICDEAFFHLQRTKRRDSIYRALSRPSKKAFVQLSLNDYMYDADEGFKKEIAGKYKRFLNKIGKKYRIDMYSSFNKDISKVREAKCLYDELGLNLKVNYKYVIDFSKRLFALRDYSFGIVNSYHTYMIARNRLQCPLYLVAMNDFYKQKAKALQGYGILSEKYTITNLDQLEKISFDYKKKGIDVREDYEKMFKIVDRVKGEVRSIIDNLDHLMINDK
ncbi:polysaccharide pyruvyl transferase family protein [Candidatus Dojkabacteria bacterium]|nr:polysaccharide pyruvyl transferase family protein [Candidatus Dojkabacteria bacterium]